jgi:hypothetical protein
VFNTAYIVDGICLLQVRNISLFKILDDLAKFRM